MKILSVNNTADIYGASRCMERVFSRFAEYGHEVHVVLPAHGPLVNLLQARGIHVHIHRELPIIDRSRIRSLSSCLEFLFCFPISVARLSILALRLRVDVIHTNVVVLPSPAVAAFITARPHVWHIRELLGEFGRMWKPYQRYISFFSKAVVAVSICTRDQFDHDLRKKVHVIYDGLDETVVNIDPIRRDAFHKSLPVDKLLVGVVGRIKWHRKGQEVLVRAVDLLRERHPQVHYVIVGSTAPGNEEHETMLRGLITSLALDNQVTLLGDTQDPFSVFAALDIAVVPSVQPEPFGCVVIEAMAAGTPVIGSNCGGIAEQIVDGVSGFLFSPGDAEALASALERLLNDPLLRERISEEGLRRVRTAFPLDRTYHNMAELFSRLASSGRNLRLRETHRRTDLP